MDNGHCIRAVVIIFLSSFEILYVSISGHDLNTELKTVSFCLSGGLHADFK